MLTKDDIKINHVYSAKKPKAVCIGFSRYCNDRMVLHLSQFRQHIETLDLGFTQEYLTWCKAKNESSVYSFTESKYYLDTGIDARLTESVMDYVVQFDSSSLKFGSEYPTISMSKFLDWVGEDVTTLTPPGNWREWVQPERVAKRKNKVNANI